MRELTIAWRAFFRISSFDRQEIIKNLGFVDKISENDFCEQKSFFQSLLILIDQKDNREQFWDELMKKAYKKKYPSNPFTYLRRKGTRSIK